MTTFAHAGHWALNLLYVGPVMAVVVLIVIDRIKYRRARAEEAAEGAPQSGPPTPG